ncbi:MAG: threonine synthase [Planctomycetes bacterium]|nr:threonine synthase [Planctomycetota bacterium]
MGLDHVTGLACVICGAVHEPAATRYTCAHCGDEGILDVRYDYERVRREMTPAALAARPRDHWRYRELLPLRGDLPLPALAVGWTPVHAAPRLAAALGLAGPLLVKDDGRNPTASFKDRASSVGVMKALEAGAQAIACASTGNAASSLAGFAAAVGLESWIFVPERAPEPKVTQLLIFGAHVVHVAGPYEDAYRLSMEACARWGWYNRNCAHNSYLVEGKKTCGLEIAEQTGADVPDWVVLSVGDGCTIAGVWKGLKEMHRLGFIPRLPRLLGVQAEGAQPIREAWLAGRDLKPGPAATIADSICVGHPRNWRKAIAAIRESGGSLIAVADGEILEAMRRTARLGGVFGEPAGVASVAGVGRAVAEGLIPRTASVLAVITGNGLKDVKTAATAVPPAHHIPPELAALEKLV